LKSFRYEENLTIDDSSVLFPHTIAIQPTAGCLSKKPQGFMFALYTSIISIRIVSSRSTIENTKAGITHDNCDQILCRHYVQFDCSYLVILKISCILV